MNNITRIVVTYHDRNVGTIALTDKGLCVFQYDGQWLTDGFSISPFELPLRAEVFTGRPRPFDGGFGVFDDCLPDGWGLLILDRYLREKGINLRNLTILDRLALVGTTGRGALEFRPDHSVISTQEYADFEKLAREAAQILDSDDYQGAGIDEFMQRGGSPGGARPKIFARHDGKEWLVKFRARHDPQNIGTEEYRYSQLAKRCGIVMPDTRLVEGKYFATERFDRSEQGKVHVVSMAGLVLADYRLPSIDYGHIMQVCATLTRDIGDLWQVFRLMVFNYLIGNKDDHAKNFAFMRTDSGWHLAPAFDLLPSDGINGYHTTSINDSINPTKEDVIAVAVNAGLDRAESERIFEMMKEIICD